MRSKILEINDKQRERDKNSYQRLIALLRYKEACKNERRRLGWKSDVDDGAGNPMILLLGFHCLTLLHYPQNFSGARVRVRAGVTTRYAPYLSRYEKGRLLLPVTERKNFFS